MVTAKSWSILRTPLQFATRRIYRKNYNNTAISKVLISTPPRSSSLHRNDYSNKSTISSTGVLIYKAPLATAVKSVKALSLATAFLAGTGAPFLIFYGNPSMSMIGRVAVTSLVSLLSVSTTLILHWFIRTYVTKLYFDKATEIVTVEMYSLFLLKRVKQFHISQAGPPKSVASFSTFQVEGTGYFLHSEVFADRELLHKLVGSFSVLEKSNTTQ